MSRKSGEIRDLGDRKWMVRWFEGLGADGVRRYKSKRVHGTKADAQKYLNKVLRSRDLGEYVEPTTLTVDGYFDRYWKDGAKGSARSREGGRWAYEAYVRPRIGKLRLDRLSPLDVQTIVSAMTGENARLRGRARPYSSRTVEIAMATLRRALNQAVRWRLLVRNPANDVELPKKVSREMPALTTEQVEKLRAELRGSKHALFFDLLLATGMRPGEALALRWRDLKDAGTLTVARALTWDVGPNGKRRRVFLEPKTAKSRRTIPLPASIIRDLAAHRAAQAEHAMKMGEIYDREAGLVFADEVGAPLDGLNLVRRHFRPAVARAKLDPRLRVYDLRHVHATLLLAAGVSVKVVSERLGHASAAMTLDVYAHVLPGMQEAATKKIEAAIFGG